MKIDIWKHSDEYLYFTGDLKESEYDQFVTELESKARELWPDKFKETKYTLVQADDGATAMLTAEEARRLDLRFRQQQIPQNSKGTK